MDHRRLMLLAIATAAAFLATGCIHHSETVQKDVDRTAVTFENDSAGRFFYEALDRRRSRRSDKTESKTSVSLPLVFSNERTVVRGPNTEFNRAVELCDANRDRVISESEARIFNDTTH
jgi:hypothetical protein